MKNGRIVFIFIGFIIFGAAIIGRLFFLQVINHKFYQAQALGQQAIFQEVQGDRGEVFFKDNTKSLAINNDKWSLYISTVEVKDRQALVDGLATVIKKTADEINAKIDAGDSYVLIDNKLTDEDVDSISALKLKGVNFERQPGRYYPQEEMASQVIGFVGGDQTGQYGIEGYYDKILEGKKTFTEEPRSLIFFDPDKLEPTSFDGSDLYLTIDYNVQYEAESLLKEAKKDFAIDSGQIIVMDPQTGRIIALANFPSFDPNQYSKENDLEIFQDSAVQKIFELGSILKPITMAIGLNEGKVTPDTTYDDPGCVEIQKHKICNFGDKKYGVQTMTQVLEKSLNTGAVFVSNLIPHSVYLSYLDKLGLGEKTDIDLQGEVYSRNDNLRNGREINFATASYGQGIDLTLIQYVRAFSVIANCGKLVRPYIVEKIINNQKEEVVTEPKIIRDGILTQNTCSQLTAMLVSAVDKGVASKAKVPGYYIAGKTGTAQVPNVGKAGYDPNKSIHSFAGFAPALSPRFVALVKLDNPKGSSSGDTAAPIFEKLAQYILNYQQIPPDYEQ